MGNIIPLHGDPHAMTQELLPWYVNGRLESGEHRMVEEHLARCAECRAELEGEARLARAYSGLLDDAPETPTPARASALAAARARPRRSVRSPAGRFGAGGLALIAASQVAIIGLSLVVYSQFQRPAAGEYHALAAPAATPAAIGNLIVIFRPDTPEQVLRATLHAVGARIVDGPTAADAYVLAVAPAALTGTLATLRARPDIVLAQPIGAELRP